MGRVGLGFVLAARRDSSGPSSEFLVALPLSVLRETPRHKTKNIKTQTNPHYISIWFLTQNQKFVSEKNLKIWTERKNDSREI